VGRRGGRWMHWAARRPERPRVTMHHGSFVLHVTHPLPAGRSPPSGYTRAQKTRRRRCPPCAYVYVVARPASRVHVVHLPTGLVGRFDMPTNRSRAKSAVDRTRT